ncbi:MAG: glycosyltransferase [Anaerolineae bacterium]|nr:glycosyltransferase [Anaerolineae bacterium]
MRIAYIVPYVPNLIRVRPYNLLTQLSKQGIDLTLFTISTNDQDMADIATLKPRLSEVLVREQPLWRSMMNCTFALPTKTPLQSVFSWNPRLQADFADRQRREKFDLVHVEHLRGSKFGRVVKSTFPDLPIVWDSVDCISHLFSQTISRSRSLAGKLMSALELNRTRRAEGELIRLFDHVLITSQTDKEALLRLAPPGNTSAPISVIPNGVDLQYFRRSSDKPRDSQTIVFIGKMSYHANISMVDYLVGEIMPKVWANRPTVKLTIVGKDPPPKIKNLAQNPLVKVTGTVDDIRPYLWSATAAVVPLVYGAGIQNKILEAMASTTPVVTTSAALSSLLAASGDGALVADTADDFSNTILRLIENPVLQQELGEAGYAYVKKYHDWNIVVTELAAIYKFLDHRKKGEVN